MKVRLALAAVVLAASFGCGSSYSSSPASPTPTPTTGGGGSPVSIVSGASTKTTTAYSPATINVAVGGSVTWTNNDNTTHTSSADGGAWNSGNIGPGASFTRTFPSAGSYNYHCAIHPGMIGTVVVQ